MRSLLVKKVQNFKTTLVDLNSSERMTLFLNKLKRKLGNLFINFLKRTACWDIPKCNKEPTIWDRVSTKHWS